MSSFQRLPEVIEKMHAPGFAVTIFLLFMLLIAPAPRSFSQDPERIDRAIGFLKTACVSGGKKIEIQAKGEGGITLRNLKGMGLEGEVSISKTELEGFVNELSELSAQQAREVRECMKPYINEILSVILESQSSYRPEAREVFAKQKYNAIYEAYLDIRKIPSIDLSNAWSPEKRELDVGLLYIDVAKRLDKIYDIYRRVRPLIPENLRSGVAAAYEKHKDNAIQIAILAVTGNPDGVKPDPLRLFKDADSVEREIIKALTEQIEEISE